MSHLRDGVLSIGGGVAGRLSTCLLRTQQPLQLLVLKASRPHHHRIITIKTQAITSGNVGKSQSLGIVVS
jgi:hypothetical protein